MQGLKLKCLSLEIFLLLPKCLSSRISNFISNSWAFALSGWMLVEHIVNLLLQMRKTDSGSCYKSKMDCSFLVLILGLLIFQECWFVSYHLYVFDIQ